MTSLDTSTPRSGTTAGSVGRRAEIGILATCGLNNFLIYGTFSALNVALPAMAKDLDGGVSTASWILLAFLLANSSTTILFAKLSDEWGRRWFYFGGILVFTLASIACLVVRDDGTLVLLRVLQGLASASSMSTSSAVISDVFPPARLPMALGVFMAVAGMSTLVGPIVGGVLIDHFGWRSIFWLAVGLGSMAIAVGWGALKNVHSPPISRFRLDGAGTVTSTGGIAALILAVQLFGDGGSRTSVVVASVVALGLLATFVSVERRSPHPLVDPQIVSGGRGRVYLAAFCAAMPSTGLAVLTTLYLQVLAGESAAVAGLYLLPMGGAMLVGSLSAGLLQRRMSARAANALGARGVAAGAVGVTGVIALDLPTVALGLVLLVVGLFQGLYQASLSARLLLGVAPNRRGIAQGLRATIMNGANALSTATVVAAVSLIAGEDAIEGMATGSARVAFILAGALLAGFALMAALLTTARRRGGRGA
ncbi:MAG: MFS transporter [Nocardioides sp.]|uniref:MFS transporter n=1 Tax=Nocardioides sp. TaxID=35761 RepID=UPI0039E2F34C